MKNKKFMFGFIIGGLIFSTITAYAAYKYQAIDVSYTPNNENFDVDNVEDAINELYSKVSEKGPTMEVISGATHKGIVYLDPTDLTKTCTSTEVNKNYTKNGTNGIPTGIKTGCMKWYIFNNSGDYYKMILDHNTTATQQWEKTDSTSSSTTASYNSSLAKVEVDKLISESKWKVQPRLITVNEVNSITGRKTFDSNDFANNYCLDDPQTYMYAKMCSTITGNHSWLYNYTDGCLNYGCDIEDSSTQGYFTSDTLTYQQSWGYGHRVWSIKYFDQLAYFGVAEEKGGIRPVITISKSIIK